MLIQLGKKLFSDLTIFQKGIVIKGVDEDNPFRVESNDLGDILFHINDDGIVSKDGALPPQILFDDTGTGLDAATVQEAVEELAAALRPGLVIPEGSNAKMGVATLVSGTVLVNTTAVGANSRIFLTAQTPGTAQGETYISAKVAGTSFTVTSANGADDRVVAWIIVDPV
jgi:hypothetical protein